VGLAAWGLYCANSVGLAVWAFIVLTLWGWLSRACVGLTLWGWQGGACGLQSAIGLGLIAVIGRQSLMS